MPSYLDYASLCSFLLSLPVRPPLQGAVGDHFIFPHTPFRKSLRFGIVQERIRLNSQPRSAPSLYTTCHPVDLFIQERGGDWDREFYSGIGMNFSLSARKEFA